MSPVGLGRRVVRLYGALARCQLSSSVASDCPSTPLRPRQCSADASLSWLCYSTAIQCYSTAIQCGSSAIPLRRSVVLTPWQALQCYTDAVFCDACQSLTEAQICASMQIHSMCKLFRGFARCAMPSQVLRLLSHCVDWVNNAPAVESTAVCGT